MINTIYSNEIKTPKEIEHDNDSNNIINDIEHTTNIIYINKSD